MTFACRYENLSEERLHVEAIQRLAQDLDLRVEDIRELYETFLGGAKQEARIKDYLVILVSRQVRASIRSRGLSTG